MLLHALKISIGKCYDCLYVIISVQQIAAIIPHKGANLELEKSSLETITKVNLSCFSQNETELSIYEARLLSQSVCRCKCRCGKSVAIDHIQTSAETFVVLTVPTQLSTGFFLVGLSDIQVSVLLGYHNQRNLKEFVLRSRFLSSQVERRKT